MTTTSLPMQAYRLTRFVIAVSLLSFGLGQGSAQAVVLSNSQAKAAALTIMAAPAESRSNAAWEVAMAYTAGTGANDAAENAARIVKYLPSKEQRLLAGRVGVGVAMNYAGQLPAITLRLAQLNSDMRKHVGLLVYQVTLAGDISMADEIAFGMNLAMVKHSQIRKQALLIAECMMSAVSNRAGSSTQDRAYEIALVSANLTLGLSTPDKHGKISSDRKKAIISIMQTMNKYLQLLAAGSPDGQELLKNAVVKFASTLQQAAGGDNKTAVAVDYILKYIAKPYLTTGLSPENGAIVSQAIDAVVGGNPPPTGDVVLPETTVVDPNRR